MYYRWVDNIDSVDSILSILLIIYYRYIDHILLIYIDRYIIDHISISINFFVQRSCRLVRYLMMKLL